jgi:hypothetical protein
MALASPFDSHHHHPPVMQLVVQMTLSISCHLMYVYVWIVWVRLGCIG